MSPNTFVDTVNGAPAMTRVPHVIAKSVAKSCGRAVN